LGTCGWEFKSPSLTNNCGNDRIINYHIRK